MNKTIQLTYTNIIERATMLSAFEAKQAVNTNGESMFEDVRITSNDSTAIKAYISEAAKLLEAQMASAFTITSTTTTDGISWTFTDIDDQRITVDADKFSEAVVTYTLSRWLENKIPNTASAYTSMFKDLSEAAIKITKTKHKPKRPSVS